MKVCVRGMTMVALLAFSIWAGCSSEFNLGQVLRELAGASREGAVGRTVADVAADDAVEPPADRPLPGADVVGLQVDNRTMGAVDVAVRFFRNGAVVHRTVLRVSPEALSFVIGPDGADRILAEATNAVGDAFPAGVFLYGEDFTSGSIAVYQVAGEGDEPEPGQEVPDTPGVNDAPTIQLVSPVEDTELAAGDVLAVQWTDADPDDDALISIGLRPADGAGGISVLASDVPEDPDAAGDVLQLVVEGVESGVYEVVGTITDGEASAESVAPGLVTVLEAVNAAPSLMLLEPDVDVAVFGGQQVEVRWVAGDDGEAFVTFHLDVDGVNFNGNERAISVPIPTFADGVTEETASLRIVGVPAGTYELLGVINDGELIGTARASGRVIVSIPAPPPPPPLETDCNENGIDDGLDISSGRSTDCNENSIPDECDIASGIALDCNQNGFPDECDLPGDFDGDDLVTRADWPPFEMCLTQSWPCTYPPCDPPHYEDPCCGLGDFDRDGDVDLWDWQLFLGSFESGEDDGPTTQAAR